VVRAMPNVACRVRTLSLFDGHRVRFSGAGCARR
jgi:hypothetical protein